MVAGGEVALQVGLVEPGNAETEDLRAVAGGIDADDHREGGAGLAHSTDALKQGHGGKGDGGEQAAPGEHDRRAVGDTVELGREVLDGRTDVEDVIQAGAGSAPGEPTKTGGVGVDPDEEALRRLSGGGERKATVTGAEVDGYSDTEAGQQVSESNQ